MTAVRIRSVTIGVDPENPRFETLGSRLENLKGAVARAVADVGMEVQTWRLVLPPVQPVRSFSRFSLGNRLDALQRVTGSVGIRWLCLPFRCSGCWPEDEFASAVLEVIRRRPNVFVHFLVGEGGEIYCQRLNTIGKIILSASRLSSNGFDNFRVGAGCEIRPNTPFFPFSYHEGANGFSLALEVIGLMTEIAQRHPEATILELRQEWVQALRQTCCVVERVAGEIEAATGWQFKGVDLSLAPYPEGGRSVARLIEDIGPRHAGQGGTLAVTSILTDMLKDVVRGAGVKAAGFNGVMFSVMEDEGLATANNARHLTVEKLLAFSSVCGCGLDMVPLAGTVFPEEIANMIFDVASLASCLHKPLGVRVLPIPMKGSNEMTDFNHDFLVNTRIFAVDGDRFRRLIGPEGNLRFSPREGVAS